MQEPDSYAIPHRSGFTLIELSIVLVIIGLIVGGVMVGRDLIEAAKIHRQISQVTEYSQAMRTFQIKYNALPGDITNDQMAAAGLPNAFNNFPCCWSGNGNGILDNLNDSNLPDKPQWEPFQFFDNLADANYIKKTFWNNNVDSGGTSAPLSMSMFPPLEINPAAGMSVTSNTDGHTWFFLGITFNPAQIGSPIYGSWMGFNWLSASGIMTPSQAFNIDTKMDDGVPSKGSVLATTTPYITDTTAGGCVTTSAAVSYNTSDTTNQCRLMMRAQ